MMKIAVIIFGDSNSGKTTTLRTLVQKYGQPKRKRMHSKYYDLTDGKICKRTFIQPSSPSEQEEKLEKLLKDRLGNKIPEKLIVAEQINGELAMNTLAFLKNNGYTVKKFYISQNGNPPHWNYQTNYSKISVMFAQRADDIFNEL